MHSCYACAPGSGAIIRRDGAAITAWIPGRFAGPPGLANGGIATGALLCPALGAASAGGDAAPHAARVTARLRRGVSLERALTLDVARGPDAFDVSLGDGEGVCISGEVAVVDAAGASPGARRGDVIGAPNPEREDDLAQLARIEPPDRPPFFLETGEHPLPGCFSCGPQNDAGLHLYPRFVEDGVVEDGVVCAPWKPSQEFDDGGGALAQLIVASALDCSSGICLPPQMQRDLLEEDRFFLLGSLEVRYLRIAPVAASYRVAAKMLLREGRKFFGFSALFDDRGLPYATAESTWIIAAITRTEAFGARA